MQRFLLLTIPAQQTVVSPQLRPQQRFKYWHLGPEQKDSVKEKLTVEHVWP